MIDLFQFLLVMMALAITLNMHEQIVQEFSGRRMPRGVLYCTVHFNENYSKGAHSPFFSSCYSRNQEKCHAYFKIRYVRDDGRFKDFPFLFPSERPSMLVEAKVPIKVSTVWD
jgi:hypothetical protein